MNKLTDELINQKQNKIDRLKKLIKKADNYFSDGDFAKGITVIIKIIKEMECE